MEMILSLATILGGIGTILFIWDKYRRRSVEKKEINNKLPPSHTFLIVLEEINKKCENDRALTIRRAPVFEEPKLIRHDRLLLSKQERSNVKEIEKSLAKEMQPNDACAVITEQIDWNDEPLTIHFSPASYAEIRAKRESGNRVLVISANTLLFSEEARCLLLHRRSSKSDYFSHTIHTIGGAFMPEGLMERGDIGGLRECAEREMLEETGVAITVPLKTPMAIIDEYGIDFIEIAFLGVNISKEQLSRIRPNWEGALAKIPFDNLREILMNQAEWTPSGWSHVIMWLALGAPGAKAEITFNDLTAEQLALEVVGLET